MSADRGDDPPEVPESLNPGTILMMVLLGASVPCWILVQLAMMTAEHGQSSLFWLRMQIGWLYLPAVAFGFTRVMKRRSEGQLVDLLVAPSVVVLALFLLGLVGD